MTTGADESTYEEWGESLAYRVFWTRFGQAAILALASSHGNSSSSPLELRCLLRQSLQESLRALREEMQFPFPPAMPPGAAKIAGEAFHKTFRHLEESFLRQFTEIVTPSPIDRQEY